MSRSRPRDYLSVWIAAAAMACIALAAATAVMRQKTAVFARKSAGHRASLNEAIPDFSSGSITQLKTEIKTLTSNILGLSSVFDPKYKWIKKDYDLSIYFVEELGLIKQSLKEMADSAKLNVPDLGFKESLPSERDAQYLLSQLYGIREIIASGITYAVEFTRCEPLGLLEKSPQEGIRIARTRLAAKCPADTLIEFIIRLNEIVPKVCFETLVLRTQERVFEMELVVEHIVTEIEPEILAESVTPAAPSEVTPRSEYNIIGYLRANNPFFVPEATVPPGVPATSPETAQATAQRVRFSYRGVAKLRGKPVVVIEDALTQETVFVAREGRIGDFRVTDFNDERAVLANVDDGKELIIKREE